MLIKIISGDKMRFLMINLVGILVFITLNLLLRTSSSEKIAEELNQDGKNNANEDETIALREKRQLPLVYPLGGTYKLLIGLGVPVPNLDHINLQFAVNFQYQYVQYQNITQLSQYYSFLTVTRGQRALDDTADRINERMVFYKASEEMLNSKGFNGHECTLRAVCEAAQYPVEDEGLVGEIVHILLTPDYGRSQLQTLDKSSEYDDLMSEYLAAQRAGAQMFHCPALYDGCPEGEGILELISTLRDD